MSYKIELTDALEFAEYLFKFWDKSDNDFYFHKQNSLIRKNTIKEVYYFWGDQKNEMKFKDMVKNQNLPWNQNKAIEHKAYLDKLIKENAPIEDIELAENNYNNSINRIKEIEEYLDK